VDRRLRIGLIVIVVLALGYPAAAWLIGMSVQHQVLDREQAALEQIPYLTVVKRDYRRGIYSSTEEVTFGLGGSFVKSLAAAGQDWGTQAQITIRNTIHHGPLPQLRACAPAVIDTVILLPPQAQQQLVAALGDKASLSIRTQMKWGGGATTVIHSTAFQKDIPDKGGLEWRGLDATVDQGREIGAQVVELNAPGLIVTSPKANLSIEGLKASTDLHRAFEAVNAGKARFSLARLAVESPEKDFKLNSQNLTLQGNTSVSGEFLNSNATLALDSLDAGKFSATQLVLELNMDHFHGPSFSSLIKAMQDAQAEQVKAALQAAPGDANALAQQQQQTTAKIAAAFQTYGLQLLGHEPVVDFSRIGFKTPEGDLMLSVKLAAPGITPADVSGGTGALVAVVPKFLQATINVRIDKTLLDKLLTQSVSDPDKSNSVTTRVQQFQDQGYIKVDGNALTTQVAFMQGQLKVNGLPFSPMMPQPAQPPNQGPPGRKPLPGPQRRIPH